MATPPNSAPLLAVVAEEVPTAAAVHPLITRYDEGQRYERIQRGACICVAICVVKGITIFALLQYYFGTK